MSEKTSYNASLSLPQEAAEKIASALTELLWPPADAIGLFDNEDGTWRVEASFAERPDADVLRKFLTEHGAGNAEISYGDVPPADWLAITQAGLHPVRAGRFIVHGRHDRERIHSRWAIEIDAGQAFGTAHHASTRGCLIAIDDLANRVHVTSVLDIGTGTGVLAIAAALAWRAAIVASDIDPVAIRVAAENLKRNGAALCVELVRATGLTSPAIRRRRPYDLVVANILARPLAEMSREIARAMTPGGIVVLSGIMEKQAGHVTAAYRAAGFTCLRRFMVSGWSTLTLRCAGRPT